MRAWWQRNRGDLAWAFVGSATILGAGAVVVWIFR